jgi:radical SAM superfamily enzyme with C-terminal helix-hairpin-helix motif
MIKVSIIDGYVDEPTCLGVPPYISPYPRYIAGAIWCLDKFARINYLTIDQLRNDKTLLSFISKSDIIIVIAGVSVPGRYLSGFPASPGEIVSILKDINKPLKILSGPSAWFGFGKSGGKKIKDTNYVEEVFDLIVKGDCEIIISEILKNTHDIESVNTSQIRKNAVDIRDFAIKGANIVKQHPFYPNHLIAEIETYRGCPRSIVGGCSFCSEPSKGPPDFRSIENILEEVKLLYLNGISHFRLGNQPCIFSYMSKSAKESEFPQPNPDALEKLFKGIRNVAPNLKTLHVDNANPGIIARYPNECKCIAKTIVKYHTSGDVAAFGVESVDPIVIKKNNLKASAEEVFSAIKLLNEIGSKIGYNGMPELLPGLNFVFGLNGETKTTYDLNFDFLKKNLDNGMLLRRINLRQIIPIPGTRMFNIGNKLILKNKREFKRFKKKVNEKIELPLLKKMLPEGRVLKDIFTEIYRGKITFGRQMGSYPLLVGIPGIHKLNIYFNVKVTNHGYRSITAVPYPLNINNAQRETIEAIPNIGKKRAIRILANRPYNKREQIIKSLDDPKIGDKILEFISIK